MMNAMQLDLFDCNCSFGRRSIVNPGSFYSMDALVGRMKYYGIGKALVYHAMAREYDPMTGNNRLLEEIGNMDCLIPVWVVMPHHTGEFPEPGELKELLCRNHIKAVRIFPAPAEQNFSIAGWSCGELFTMLEKCRIPLMIGMDQIKWEELHEIGSVYSGLKVMITGMNYRMDRYIYPLLSKFENLCIETSGYKGHHGIEEICRNFGANRLIYGSGMPEFSGSAAASLIRYARISDGEREMIAGGNLEKLIGGISYA